MKKKLLFVLFAVLTLAVGATAATSSVIERTGKSIKKERTAPARQVAKADADKSPTVYGWLRYVEHAPSDQQYGVCRFNAGDPSTVDVLFPFDAEHQAAPVRQPTVSTTFTATLRATMQRLLISAR